MPEIADIVAAEYSCLFEMIERFDQPFFPADRSPFPFDLRLSNQM